MPWHDGCLRCRCQVCLQIILLYTLPQSSSLCKHHSDTQTYIAQKFAPLRLGLFWRRLIGPASPEPLQHLGSPCTSPSTIGAQFPDSGDSKCAYYCSRCGGYAVYGSGTACSRRFAASAPDCPAASLTCSRMASQLSAKGNLVGSLVDSQSILAVDTTYLEI